MIYIYKKNNRQYYCWQKGDSLKRWTVLKSFMVNLMNFALTFNARYWNSPKICSRVCCNYDTKPTPFTQWHYKNIFKNRVCSWNLRAINQDTKHGTKQCFCRSSIVFTTNYEQKHTSITRFYNWLQLCVFTLGEPDRRSSTPTLKSYSRDRQNSRKKQLSIFLVSYCILQPHKIGLFQLTFWKLF